MTLVIASVDGIWTTWSAWSACSQTCDQGEEVRTRTCEGPFYGGEPCSGDEEEKESCKLRDCAGGHAIVFSVWFLMFGVNDCAIFPMGARIPSLSLSSVPLS